MTARWLAALLGASFVLAQPGAGPARAQWTSDGIPVCTATDSQSVPHVVPDGAGGALTSWIDPRSGYNSDVYALRTLPGGAIAAGWPANGYFATYFGVYKYELDMAADGAGGALMTWADKTPAGPIGTPTDIICQRVSPTGTVAPGWPRNGTRLCAAEGNQRRPKLCGDGAGGAFVVWEDRRVADANIYAQHVTSGGTIASGWPADGMALCWTPGDQVAPAIIADGAGGAIVTWQDDYAGGNIGAQRIAADGSVAPGWPAGGLALCPTPGPRRGPVLASDTGAPTGGGSGAIIAWEDRSHADADIYAVRVTGAGTVAAGWTSGGSAMCDAAGDQLEPVITADSAGGAILAWQDGRGADADIYALRVAADGTVMAGWTANGGGVCLAAGDQRQPAIAGDGASGAYLLWTDRRDSATTSDDIYGVRLTAAGGVAAGWDAGGTSVCKATGGQSGPNLCADGAGGAYAVWTDRRNAGTSREDVYLLRLLSDGPVPTRIGALSATHHDGQTFLSWALPIGLGWTFRVYASAQPITGAADLDQTTLLGAVGDSTWYDRRLSTILGTSYAYRTDSLAPELTPAQGLFVATPLASGTRYYAVTTQQAGYPEDRTVRPGSNALAAPVTETLEAPRPVFQRSLPVRSVVCEIYSLWVTDQETALFQAMANRASLAFDCAVVRGGTPPNNPLLVRLHARQGNFLQAVEGTSQPGEWRLSLDDPLPNGQNTFWYGYHRGYDVTRSTQPPPAEGEVCDYTLSRAVYTILWARRTLPIDTAWVCAQGYSMAGVGSVLLAFERPGLIASVQALVGKYDFSLLDDPNPLNAFNTGGSLRQIADQQWGTVPEDLPSCAGSPVFDRLDLVHELDARPWLSLPPFLTYNGKNDVIVGWAEKIPFYSAMERHRQGGYLYWDQRDHTNNAYSAWSPMQDTRYLYRFRTDRSFPALSRCSTDDDPGDGNAASGDSVGQFNVFVEWDTIFVDTPGEWQTRLWTRPLVQLWGPLPAPESLTVDVTPRRLQRFPIVPGGYYAWAVRRLPDSATVQSGHLVTDPIGLLTVNGVKVYRTGSLLTLTAIGQLDAGPSPGVAARGPLLRFARIPAGSSAELLAVWPRRGPARIELLDVGGRVVRTLFRGEALAGPSRLVVETASLPGGVYFAVARQPGARATARLVVIH
ncbi:MAG: hypothetical protein HZC42_15475 [Candidatus Eisenbacteria bacterium]|nr:hypothetical protein [Candidatus Eisenbacteria bacterium]